MIQAISSHVNGLLPLSRVRSEIGSAMAKWEIPAKQGRCPAHPSNVRHLDFGRLLGFSLPYSSTGGRYHATIHRT